LNLISRRANKRKKYGKKFHTKINEHKSVLLQSCNNPVRKRFQCTDFYTKEFDGVDAYLPIEYRSDYYSYGSYFPEKMPKGVHSFALERDRRANITERIQYEFIGTAALSSRGNPEPKVSVMVKTWLISSFTNLEKAHGSIPEI
jgi:hypothetical protein